MNNKAVNNKADRYIEDVLRRVVLPSARKDDLRADLREHFAAAEEGREPVEEVIQSRRKWQLLLWRGSSYDLPAFGRAL